MAHPEEETKNSKLNPLRVWWIKIQSTYGG
jgi:hypothetical protein